MIWILKEVLRKKKNYMCVLQRHQQMLCLPAVTVITPIVIIYMFRQFISYFQIHKLII